MLEITESHCKLEISQSMQVVVIDLLYIVMCFVSLLCFGILALVFNICRLGRDTN
uniref:Uncharacterized protein n=1 Tax=Rhizophora mucronata TaxID=61149 RepID=A0A2P2IWH1_RHIMU